MYTIHSHGVLQKRATSRAAGLMLCIALGCAGHGALAADRGTEPTGFGVTVQCADWLRNPQSVGMQSWLVGYLTGINQMLGQRYNDPLRGVEAKEVLGEVRRFCQSNRSATLASTAYTYYLYLSTKSKPERAGN
ncbi:hypothetical protein [Cupriavidus necator]|uniref:hypothetical protein n=1 Tax=Cupriavidus necator TaxID=106590 RepID=UPI0005B30F04|nr:hypothetical protein [Cupriavidus necator]